MWLAKDLEDTTHVSEDLMEIRKNKLFMCLYKLKLANNQPNYSQLKLQMQCIIFFF